MWDPNGPLASKTPAPTVNGSIQPAPGAALPASGAQMQQPPAATTRSPAASGQAQPSVETGGGFAIPGDREQELARARAEAETKLKADLRAQELARTKAKAEEASASKMKPTRPVIQSAPCCRPAITRPIPPRHPPHKRMQVNLLSTMCRSAHSAITAAPTVKRRVYH